MATALVATAVTGLLLLAVALALARGIEWRSNEIFAPRQDGGGLLGAVVHSPVAWVIVFLALALGVTGVAIAAVGGFGLSLPGGIAAVAAPFGALLLAYLVFGTYAAVRERDVSPAGATLASTLVVGVLLLVAIVVRLLT